MGIAVWHPLGLGDRGRPSTALAVLLAMAASADWARGVLRRGTQPARLLVLLAALLLPSLALYPALSGLAAREPRRRRSRANWPRRSSTSGATCSSTCARRSTEIDRMEGMSDLVAASVPPASGPVAVDAAFHVWSQTSLAAAA